MNELDNIRQEGREWVKNYYGVIRQALDEQLRDVIQVADDMPYINPDIYSNALCSSVYRIPQSLRRGLRIANGYFIENNNGDPYDDSHTWLDLESLIICPTFGQRRDLDTEIARMPELFVGRVLIAFGDEIKNNFNLEYRFKYFVED